MSLSCSCNFDGDCAWYYSPPSDFKLFAAYRRKRCCSCKKLIDIGSNCLEFGRWRDPLTNIEEDICGTDVGLASWYLCDWCGEMYLNLEALGYCYMLGDSLKEAMAEYWELTGFTPKGAQ